MEEGYAFFAYPFAARRKGTDEAEGERRVSDQAYVETSNAVWLFDVLPSCFVLSQVQVNVVLLSGSKLQGTW